MLTKKPKPLLGKNIYLPAWEPSYFSPLRREKKCVKRVEKVSQTAEGKKTLFHLGIRVTPPPSSSSLQEEEEKRSLRLKGLVVRNGGGGGEMLSSVLFLPVFEIFPSLP